MTVGGDKIAEEERGGALSGVLRGLLVILGIGALVLLFVFVVWYVVDAVGAKASGPFDVGIVGAALAGLISFLSPCVLPLVLPYLGYLGGTTFDELSSGDATASKGGLWPRHLGGRSLRARLFDRLRLARGRGLGGRTVHRDIQDRALHRGRCHYPALRPPTSSVSCVFRCSTGKPASMPRSSVPAWSAAYIMGSSFRLWLDAMYRSGPRHHPDLRRQRSGR